MRLPCGYRAAIVETLGKTNIVIETLCACCPGASGVVAVENLSQLGAVDAAQAVITTVFAAPPSRGCVAAGCRHACPRVCHHFAHTCVGRCTLFEMRGVRCEI